MHQSNGLFLESLFGFMAVVFIIIENNMAGAILCFILIGLVDVCWVWE